jgi:hypothetical protein
VTSALALSAGRVLDEERASNATPKNGVGYRARAVQLKKVNAAWRQGGHDGGAHGYCDNEEEGEGLVSGGVVGSCAFCGKA